MGAEIPEKSLQMLKCYIISIQQEIFLEVIEAKCEAQGLSGVCLIHRFA